MIVKNDLFDYKDRYIFQDNKGFKFSLASILLAEYATSRSSQTVLDLCTGNAAVPLIMSTYNNGNYVCFEIQESVYELGLKSINYNKLDNRIKIINDDIRNIKSYYQKESFDVITCNPPFFRVNDLKSVNKNDLKAIARHEVSFSLEDAFIIGKDYLTNKGILYLVHRSERIDEIITLAHKYNINVKNIQLISTKKDVKPSILLVKCVKNSKMGVVVDKEICIEGLETYQNIFREIK